jgi:hypothetical protein
MEIGKLLLASKADQPRPNPRPDKRSFKSNGKLMNIEHRTSNIERRMKVFCRFKNLVGWAAPIGLLNQQSKLEE